MIKCKCCNESKSQLDFYYKRDREKYDSVCKKCRIEKKVILKSDTHKVCKHCHIEKPFSEYQKAGGGKWLQPYCKSCDSERKKKHRTENIEHYKLKGKEKYLSKRDELLAKDKAERAARRPETLTRLKKIRSANNISSEERKRRKSDLDRKYREKNRDKIIENKRKYYESGRALEIKKVWQKKKMNDISFRITKNLRGRIYVALKRGIKSKPTKELLGCSIDHFKQYFQSLFTEGMSWEKYMAGEIVIDHKIPCASFDLTKAEEQRKCFHYSNLQPLWELDNLIKGAKILTDAHY